MKFKIFAIFPCLILFSISLITAPHLSPSRLTGIHNTETTDWWPMYHHDPMHTGYSTSSAPNTNQILWTHRLGDWVRSSPAVYNGLVYVGSDDNKIYALNATTGEEVWNYTTNGDIVSCPAVVRDRVYIGSTDDSLYCLNAETGNLVWKYTTGGDIQSSPCVTEGKVLFGSDDCKIYAIDTTGSHLWNYSTGDYVRSSPAVSSGRVFVGSADRNVYALDLYSGSLVWNHTTITSVLTSPAVLDGRVFVSSSSEVYSLNETDGDLIWSYTTGGSIHSSPATFGGNIFIGSDDHKVYCLNATSGHPQWNFTTGDSIHSSPAIADGKVFFGSEDRKVYCLNVNTGQCVWHYYTGGRIIYSSPAVAIETVFIGSSYMSPLEGKIYAFHTTNEPPEASNLTIRPSLPVTTDDLVGSYDYYDPDGDPESGTQIIWYKDYVPQPKLINVLTVPSNLTTKGQTWYFIVRPNDGKVFGDWQTSPSVTIQNSPPTIDSYYPSTDPTMAEGESQEFNITKSDADLDPLTVVWYLNGTMLLESSDSYIHTAEPGSKGIYNITVTVSDIASQTKHEWTLTVISKHDIAITNVTRSKAIVGQGYSMSINVTVENQGDTTDTFNITAYANTTAIQTMETTLTSGNSTTITFTWNTTGVAKGNNYTIAAYAEPIPGETDTTDNNLTDGWVFVTIAGDVDGDCICDMADISMMIEVFMTKPGDPKWNPNCDINDDKAIDMADISIAIENFTKTCAEP